MNGVTPSTGARASQSSVFARRDAKQNGRAVNEASSPTGRSGRTISTIGQASEEQLSSPLGRPGFKSSTHEKLHCFNELLQKAIASVELEDIIRSERFSRIEGMNYFRKEVAAIVQTIKTSELSDEAVEAAFLEAKRQALADFSEAYGTLSRVSESTLQKMLRSYQPSIPEIKPVWVEAPAIDSFIKDEVLKKDMMALLGHGVLDKNRFGRTGGFATERMLRYFFISESRFILAKMVNEGSARQV